jgi:PAS domain S-box-containing protein
MEIRQMRDEMRDEMCDEMCDEMSNEVRDAYKSEIRPELRRQAEQILSSGKMPEVAIDATDVRRLIHEVHVCHAELEVQNEELRSTQSELEEVSRRYRDLFDLAPAGYIVVDTKGLILEINRTAMDMLRSRSAQNLMRPFLAYVDAEDRPAYVKMLRNTAASGRGSTCELRFRRADYTVLEGMLVSTRLPTTRNQPGCILLALSDITALKTAEQQRKSFEDNLQQIQKMEAIGRLAGGVAHDFNNLLGGILGSAELLRTEIEQRPDLVDLLERVETISKTAERASVLTRNLLTFARKSPREDVVVDIHRLVNDVVELISHTVDPRIRIERKLTAWPSTVTGDPSGLQNALLNLAVNAGDAMPEGGELTFRTAVRTLDERYVEEHGYEVAAGEFLEISVQDTGYGMDAEILSSVFEPFFTTKDVGKGTGLGLAMVYATIKDHGGCITVDSEPGRGSTFRVLLPLSNDVEETEASPCQDDEVARGSGVVLVIDDEEVIREMAVDALAFLGYDVLTAENGKAAIEVFSQQAHRIDLVVLDALMPEISGLDTFRKLKEIQPDVHVLVSSGYIVDLDGSEFHREGVRGFIQKPYRLNQFAEAVAAAMRRDEP